MSTTFNGSRFGGSTTSPTTSNNPNLAANQPFTVQTSYIAELYKANVGLIANNLEAGYGAIAMRDVANEIVLYKPFNFVIDTLNQLMSKYRTTNKIAVEWYAEDMLHPGEAAGLAGVTSAAATINGTGANGSYTPGATGKTFTVAAGLGTYFRKDDKVRYAKDGGGWQYAVITDISTDTITLASLDAGNLVKAVSETTKLELLGSIRNIERNIEIRSRGSVGEMDYTYVENFSHERTFSRLAQTVEMYVDIYTRNQEKLFNQFRLNRASNAYYGIRGKRAVTLPSGETDYAYASPGIWDLVYNYSRQEGDFTTAGVFDANKFKSNINRFVEFNFGAESGGPENRQVLTNAKFASYLSQAYEDKQRFYSQEYVAGIRCNRFENNLGVLDFLMDPFLEYRSPMPSGSLKDGAGLAVALMVPMAECVTRVQFEGGGPRTEEFKVNGGDRDMTMRVEAIEGIQMANLEYCSALVEVNTTTD